MNNTRHSPLKAILIITVSVILVGLMTVLTLVAIFGNRGSESSYPDTSFEMYVSNSDLLNSEETDEISEIIIEISDIGDLSDEMGDVSSDSSQAFNENSQEEEPLIYHGWVINPYGYTYVYGDTGFEQFNYKNTALDRYVNGLNTLASAIPADCRFFNMIAPVQSSFYDIPREIYVGDNFYNASQKAFVSTVESKLADNILDIPLIGKIERRFDDGEYMFFRTDKNWTAHAAYDAYAEYCEKADFSALSKGSFQTRAIEDFLGSFYKATTMKSMKENPDRLDYFYPNAGVDTTLTAFSDGRVYTDYRLSGNGNSTNLWKLYLGTEADYYKIDSTSNGGTLVAVGDTSLLPMLPFLATHYSCIYVVNTMVFEGSIADFVAEQKADDVLTICYSTGAVSGEYVPTFNRLCGITGE